MSEKNYYILKKGNGYDSNYMEILVDAAADLPEYEELSFSPGSIAHTAGDIDKWEADMSHQWVDFANNSFPIR